jgi:hypothetical protein
MAQNKQPLVKITDGLIKGISENKVIGFRTLSDIDNNDILGGITSRQGFKKNNSTYTYSELVRLNNRYQLPMGEYLYDVNPTVGNVNNINPITDNWTGSSGQALISYGIKSFFNHNTLNGWLSSGSGQPIIGLVYGVTEDINISVRGTSTKDIKIFNNIRLKQLFAVGNILTENPNLKIKLTWRKIIPPTDTDPYNTAPNWNWGDLIPYISTSNVSVSYNPDVTKFTISDAIWTVEKELNNNISTYPTETLGKFRDIVLETPETSYGLNKNDIYLLQIEFTNVISAMDSDNYIGYLALEPVITSDIQNGTRSRNGGFFINDSNYLNQYNVSSSINYLSQQPLIVTDNSWEWTLENINTYPSIIDSWDNLDNKLIMVKDNSGKISILNKDNNDIIPSTVSLYDEDFGLMCKNAPDKNTYVIQLSTPYKCAGIRDENKGNIYKYRNGSNFMLPIDMLKIDNTKYTLETLPSQPVIVGLNSRYMDLFYSSILVYDDGTEGVISVPIKRRLGVYNIETITGGTIDHFQHVSIDFKDILQGYSGNGYKPNNFYNVIDNTYQTIYPKILKIKHFITAQYLYQSPNGKIINKMNTPIQISYIGETDLSKEVGVANPDKNEFYITNEKYQIAGTNQWSHKIVIAHGGDIINVDSGTPEVTRLSLVGNFYMDVNKEIIDIEDFYIPKPFSIEIFNNRLIGGGDPLYPKSMFFTSNAYNDFEINNSTILPLANGDTHITSINELGGILFAFGKSSIVRIYENSIDFPYYRVESIEGLDNIGTLSPKSIIKASGRMYFMATDLGFVEFDGNNYKILSGEINDYIKGIDFKYYNGLGEEVDNPFGQSNTRCDATRIESYYDKLSKSIYIAIPYNSTELNVILKLYLPTGKWSTLVLNSNIIFKGFVKNQGSKRLSIFDTLGNFYTISESNKVEGGINIDSVIETTDIDFGEDTQFDVLTLKGLGTIDLYAYIQKSETESIKIEGIVLNENGLDIPLGLIGRVLRIKMIVKDSTNFKLIDDPIIYFTNNGKKGSRVAK